MSKRRVFFIDPQSMRNLSVYDYWVQSELTDEIYYFCSKHYDYRQHPNIVYKPVFAYNDIQILPLKVLSYVYSYIAILTWAIRVKPSIVHLQWAKLYLFDYLCLWLIKKITGAKYVHTAHNVLPHHHGERHKRDFARIYNLADKIITHTEVSKEELTDTFHLSTEKIAVIRHGILQMDYDKELLQKQEAQLKQQYPLNGKFVVMALGEQSRYKGTDILLDVWGKTKKLNSDPTLHLVCVGKAVGIDFSSILECINVTTDNRKISNEEFIYLMRHADLYVLPYRQISQSGALMTALAERVPVLVTNVGGLTDPLKVADVGWIIPESSHESVCNKLIELTSHREEVRHKKMDEKEWRKIEEAFGWKSISRSTQLLYDSLV